MPGNLWTVKVGMAGLRVAYGANGAASLPEIGSQGVVSEILSGKRELNVLVICACWRHGFNVSPAVFIGAVEEAHRLHDNDGI